MSGTQAAVDAAAIGTIVSGRALRFSLARMLAFSGGAFDEAGWPQRNLHTDIECAREAGLAHIIASGTQSEGLLIGFLIDTFGSAHWYRDGQLEVRFLKPVKAGDVVRPKLRWTSRESVGERTQWTAECWCELESGDRVVDGMASCSIPSRGPHAHAPS
ncbi:MAG TPA: MaoC family dehydratase [Casimicrobiaceae bacterium]|nr:MaoC family dehydratase [Casimicrobiaceae bacterium]